MGDVEELADIMYICVFLLKCFSCSSKQIHLTLPFFFFFLSFLAFFFFLRSLLCFFFFWVCRVQKSEQIFLKKFWLSLEYTKLPQCVFVCVYICLSLSTISGNWQHRDKIKRWTDELCQNTKGKQNKQCYFSNGIRTFYTMQFIELQVWNSCSGINLQQEDVFVNKKTLNMPSLKCRVWLVWHVFWLIDTHFHLFFFIKH